MNSIVEDCVISYKKESDGSSSQRHKVKDENLHCAVNADMDYAGNKHESFFDTLLWLRSLAIDHYKEKSPLKNSQKLRNQILRARKILTLSLDEAPWRKRKLDQLLQETVAHAYDSPSAKPIKGSSTKREKCSIASSFRCLINSADSEGSFDLKGTPNGRSSEALETSSTLDTEILLAPDTDDSVSGSNISSSRKPLAQATKHRPIKLLKSGNNDPRKQVRISSYKEVSLLCTPKSSSYKKERKHNTPQRPAKLSDFFGDSLSRMAIPVGPRFQAEIPDVSLSRMAIPVGPHFQAEIPDVTGVPIRYSSADGDTDSDDSEKWLGTRIWPTEGISVGISTNVIGKGRPISCSCNSPGSIQCNKLHITEKRHQLQRDLSSVFFSWKFDEMGEEVSKSWTFSEQKNFSNLVKFNPVSKNMSFWKPALKCFASKPKESLVSYYFNVFVLRRMSKQTRLASKVVDSDDDEADEGVVGQSKDVKERYLTGLR